MSITEAIELLKTYNGPLGLKLHNGANEELISKVEATYGITLPEDFKVLYRFTDGFETTEDIFNMIPLAEIISNKNRNKGDPLYIAEYMIYSEMWQLEINPDDCNDYEIVVDSNYNKLVLTESFGEFIQRFLKGGVFDPGGLYDWHEEVESQPIYTTKLKTVEVLLTVFYFSLRYSLISKEEVTGWADAIVVHENEPESFFIDISLSHDKNELISLLNPVHVPGNSAVARAILGLLYHRLSTGVINVEQAITIMDKHNFSELLTPFEVGHLSEFTDKLWVNDSIIYDEELTQNVLNFLVYYKNFEIGNHKYWAGLSYQLEYKFQPKIDSTSNIRAQKKAKRKRYAIIAILAVLASACILLDSLFIRDMISSSADKDMLYVLGPVLTWQVGRAIFYMFRKGARRR